MAAPNPSDNTFVVISFDDRSTRSVLDIWVQAKRRNGPTFCHWPKSTSEEKLKRLIAEKRQPSSKWHLLACRVLSPSFELLEQALKWEDDYLKDVSDVASNALISPTAQSPSPENVWDIENDPFPSVATVLEDLQQKVTALTRQVQELQIQLTTYSEEHGTLLRNVVNIVATEKYGATSKISFNDCELPIKTVENLQKLDGLLKNPEIKNNFISVLSRCGGVNFKQGVKNILLKIIDPILAENLNWDGRGAKSSFKTMNNIIGAIFETTELNPLGKGTEAELKPVIQIWLQQAKSRNAGKNGKQQSELRPVE